MKIRSIATGASATAFCLLFAAPVSALTAQYGADAELNVSGEVVNAVDAGSSAGVNVSGSASTGVGATSGGTSSSAELGASLRVMLNTLIGGSASANQGSSASETNSRDTDEALTARLETALSTIFVTRADIESGSAVPTSSNAASVQSEADLKGFVAAHVESDKNVESIELAQDSVSVTYKERAYIFAFIPVTVDVTATVDASGNVEVSYPWYSFLMTTDKDELEAKIQNRVSVGVEASADATAQMSAETQARLVADVKAAMAETLAEAEAAADVSADASGALEVR